MDSRAADELFDALHGAAPQKPSTPAASKRVHVEVVGWADEPCGWKPTPEDEQDTEWAAAAAAATVAAPPAPVDTRAAEELFAALHGAAPQQPSAPAASKPVHVEVVGWADEPLGWAPTPEDEQDTEWAAAAAAAARALERPRGAEQGAPAREPRAAWPFPLQAGAPVSLTDTSATDPEPSTTQETIDAPPQPPFPPHVALPGVPVLAATPAAEPAPAEPRADPAPPAVCPPGPLAPYQLLSDGARYVAMLGLPPDLEWALRSQPAPDLAQSLAPAPAAPRVEVVAREPTPRAEGAPQSAAPSPAPFPLDAYGWAPTPESQADSAFDQAAASLARRIEREAAERPEARASEGASPGRPPAAYSRTVSPTFQMYPDSPRADANAAGPQVSWRALEQAGLGAGGPTAAGAGGAGGAAGHAAPALSPPSPDSAASAPGTPSSPPGDSAPPASPGLSPDSAASSPGASASQEEWSPAWECMTWGSQEELRAANAQWSQMSEVFYWSLAQPSQGSRLPPSQKSSLLLSLGELLRSDPPTPPTGAPRRQLARRDARAPSPATRRAEEVAARAQAAGPPAPPSAGPSQRSAAPTSPTGAPAAAPTPRASSEPAPSTPAPSPRAPPSEAAWLSTSPTASATLGSRDTDDPPTPPGSDAAFAAPVPAAAPASPLPGAPPAAPSSSAAAPASPPAFPAPGLAAPAASQAWPSAFALAASPATETSPRVASGSGTIADSSSGQ